MGISDIQIGTGTLFGIASIAALVYFYQDYAKSKKVDDVGDYLDRTFAWASSDDNEPGFDDSLREAQHSTKSYYGGKKTRKNKSNNKKTKRR